MNRLQQILEHKRRELTEAPEHVEPVTALPPPMGFASALRAGGPGPVAVIAEVKRKSPSKGALRAGADPALLARQYARAGASAISVLTDSCFFDGCLSHLQAVREAVRLPLLRKDFILDESQVIAARACGADAILLIAAALDDAALNRLNACAQEHGLDVLLEVHDAAEMERALRVSPACIGINNRNLRTFETDLCVTTDLMERYGAHLTGASAPVVVSESGIGTSGDLRVLRACGVHAALIGEALVTQSDPEAALREMLQ